MSTVRIAVMRFSSVAKRARNSAAASRIAAGRSPRGHVELASSNSWKGLSPMVSGLSITAIRAPLAARRCSWDCSRAGLPSAADLLAAAHSVAPVDDRLVTALAAADEVAAAATRFERVPARATGEAVAPRPPEELVVTALTLELVAPAPAPDTVVTAARRHSVP